MVGNERFNAQSTNDGLPHMTPEASQIFRAFAHGESIARIAENCNVSYGQAWSQIRRAVTELDRKGGATLDAVRWQNYLLLMRIVDQAFAACEKSAEDGVKEITSQTIESANDRGKLGLSSRRVIHHVRKDAGDVRSRSGDERSARGARSLQNRCGGGKRAKSGVIAVWTRA